jgi:hypothetical protein
MLLAGVSVVFKQIASNYKAVYEPSLKTWAKATSGLTGNSQISEWIMMNKPAVKAWIAQQSDVMQSAYVMDKAWNNYSGYLMLGAACGLSALIILKMLKGIAYERKLAAQGQALA